MGGMDHQPAAPAARESLATSDRNARYGMWLFLLYLFFYVGFVLLSAFWPNALTAIGPGGVNLAVTYGLVLIVAALGLALVYAWLCRHGATPRDGERA